MSVRHNRAPKNTFVEKAAAVGLFLALGAVAFVGGRTSGGGDGRPQRDGSGEPAVEYVTGALPYFESAKRPDGSIDYYAKKIVQKVSVEEDGDNGLQATMGGRPVSVTIKLPKPGPHEKHAYMTPLPDEPAIHYETAAGDTSVLWPPDAREASHDHGISMTIRQDAHGGLVATHHGEPVGVILDMPAAGPGAG